MNNSKLILY